MTTGPTGGPSAHEQMGETRTDVAGTVSELAAAIKHHDDDRATMRVAVVTAIGTGDGKPVQTDQTGSAWVARARDTALYVGDRVAVLQQHSVWIVIGRLSGEPGAVPIGAIMPFAGSAAPAGWMVCDGTAISRTTYATLYQIVGNGYGAGNGTTTFNLPNLQGRFPLGAQGLTYFQTATGGAATVTLTDAQMPSHNHGAVGDHQHALNNAAVTTEVNGTGASPVASHEPGNTASAGGHTHSTNGSDQPHENMPPWLAILYIIRVL